MKLKRLVTGPMPMGVSIKAAIARVVIASIFFIVRAWSQLSI